METGLILARIRLSPWPSLALLAGLALVVPGHGALAARQQPAVERGLADNMVAPLSLAMQKAGDAQLALGKTQAAADQFEAALAADPRNLNAYIGLARAAEADGLTGKAVRFYREALAIEPNDASALELQGVVLVKIGAKARAQDNLDRLKKVCPAPCPAADRLATAIARGPTTEPKGQTAAAAEPRR